MFDPTQPAQQTRPKTTSFAQPNKKCWTAHNWAQAPLWAQCYSINNWISHWCKVSKFHWTTLMQNTLDITGAGHEYDFIWLYTGYSISVQWKDTTQVYNSGVTDGGSKVQTCPLTRWMQKLIPILLIFRYSVLFWFSVCCYFLRVSEVFGLLFSGDFGF